MHVVIGFRFGLGRVFVERFGVSSLLAGGDLKLLFVSLLDSGD